ncbi:MAG TPA: tRNA uridine-5-carboxymethylaminomethyl(34) synthesis enzyme MnmG, partial [Burkholderiales bacterium]|nr:tRNA uridine-5-carboxymethylaminomethyl(34) synthesis enzyme MnmG [Burkholderiales bacterium]
TEIGRTLGIVDDVRWEAFDRKREAVAREVERLKSVWINPKLLAADQMQNLFGQILERDYPARDLLRRPGVHYRDLMTLAGVGPGIDETQAAEQVEIQIKYQGYIDRQQQEVARQEQFETWRLPQDLDYRDVRGLSVEVQQKLNKHRPETIGQAERISGMTPAAISLLLVHLKRGTGTTGSRAGNQTARAGRTA